MSVEVITEGLIPVDAINKSIKKRRTKKRAKPAADLGQMPREVLENIFLALDPKTVSSALNVCRRFAIIGTNRLHKSLFHAIRAHSLLYSISEDANKPFSVRLKFPHFLKSSKNRPFFDPFFAGNSRFWNRLLESYWHAQTDFGEGISKRLALSATAPIPQVHFMSYHHFALTIQEVAQHAEWLTTSMHMPFSGSTYLGLTLPHTPIRNALARFYPDRQFYLAAFGAEDTNFNFSSLVLNTPKTRRLAANITKRSSRDKRRTETPRHFFPIGLKSCEEQSSFLLNFKGAKVSGTTEAMLLAQSVSSLLVSVHTKSSLGRLSIKIPGLTTLPPPADITRFFVRSTILIAKIPSLAIEFKFEDGCLSDLRMHNPANPWEFVE